MTAEVDVKFGVVFAFGEVCIFIMGLSSNCLAILKILPLVVGFCAALMAILRVVGFCAADMAADRTFSFFAAEIAAFRTSSFLAAETAAFCTVGFLARLVMPFRISGLFKLSNMVRAFEKEKPKNLF